MPQKGCLMYRVLVLTAVVLSSAGAKAGCVDLGSPRPYEEKRLEALEAAAQGAALALAEALIEASPVKAGEAKQPYPAPGPTRYPITGCFGPVR